MVCKEFGLLNQTIKFINNTCRIYNIFSHFSSIVILLTFRIRPLPHDFKRQEPLKLTAQSGNIPLGELIRFHRLQTACLCLHGIRRASDMSLHLFHGKARVLIFFF